MTLLGLPLATLLPIAGAATAAAVVLYILKLKRRPELVPFSPIWERVLRDREATTWFSQLKRLLSLLLQLVLLGLLIFAVGDPRPGGRLGEGRNIVVLVDTSASMKATDVAPTRIDAARAKVGELVRGRAATDRVLIAALDASVTPLSTLTDGTPELEAAVTTLAASDTRADLRRGLAFALDVLTGLPHGEVVIVSDGRLGDAGIAASGLDLAGVTLRWVPVGERGRNAAITAFSARRYPLDKSRAEVMLEVTSFASEPLEVELSLLGDGQIIDVTRLAVQPGERLPRFYPNLAGASRKLEAQLTLATGARDDLPADDRAFALMPERRRARVLVVSRGNNYLDAALLLDEYLEVTSVPPKAYPPPGQFDVTIFDGVAPTPAEGSGSLLYLGAPEAGAPLKRGKALTGYVFDRWDEKSPFLRWLELNDVQTTRGFTLVAERGDQVLGASDAGPVLVSGRRGARRFLQLGFDPGDSDFVVRVSWPLFILDVIDTFVSEDTGYVSSYRTGDVGYVPVPSGAESATLVDPAGARRVVPVRQGRAVVVAERAGFYEIETGAPGDGARSGFAVNLLDPDESRIEPPTELALAGITRGLPPVAAGLRREIWVYLLVAALGLALAEWLSYHRRWTV